MAPVIQVAMVGCPVLLSLPRNFGARPSMANACNTRGPPSALPKALDRMAPHIPG